MCLNSDLMLEQVTAHFMRGIRNPGVILPRVCQGPEKECGELCLRIYSVIGSVPLTNTFGKILLRRL
jgi:hypothetical protein